MADEKATPKTETPKTPATESRTSVPSAADVDRNRRLGVSTGGTTAAQVSEYEALGVNPQLDNRTGDQRPRKVEWPAKPQQIPGAEVGHFQEHAEKYRALADKFKDNGEPLGSRSLGAHGLGEDDDKLSAN